MTHLADVEGPGHPAARRVIHPLVTTTWIPRAIALAMGLFAIGSTFDQTTSTGEWAWVLFVGAIYAHAVRILSALPRDTRRAGMFVLHLDCMLCGTWLAVARWNPILCATFVAITIGNGLLLAGTRIFAPGLLLVVAGAVLGGGLLGYHYQPVVGPLTTALALLTITCYSWLAFYLTYLVQRSLLNARQELSTRAADLAAAHDLLKERKEQMEDLAGKLAKYLSPQVYKQIFTGEKEVRIETYRKKLTIFFSDVKGFTEMTDSMEAESLTNLLNSYLNEMSMIALRFGGTIDKFIGDAIMIFFGDPTTRGEKEDAIVCLRMAIEMRERMVELRRRWADQGNAKALHVRMGINSGFCTVGNFGSDDRLDYTIIGGQVNLASRLESNAQPDQILISEGTWLLVKDQIACLKKGEIQVKGISHPVQTYEVVDLHERVAGRSEVIRAEGAGYSLALDLGRISGAERDRVAGQLEEALAILRRAAEGEPTIPATDGAGEPVRELADPFAKRTVPPGTGPR